MANVNVKEVSGGETQTLNDSDGFLIDTGSVSYYIVWQYIKSLLKTFLSTFSGSASDWKEVSDSWSYASASTITVPSGATSLYQKGDALRIKQAAGYKYFYIITVASTLLTVTGGSDYSVANSAITDIAINRSGNPFGHPIWLNSVAPTWTVSTIDDGAGGQPTTTMSRFFIRGSVCTHKIRVTGTKATSNKFITFTVSADLPAHVEANGSTLGSATFGNVDFVGCITAATATTRTFVSADSITDNQTLSGGVAGLCVYEY